MGKRKYKRLHYEDRQTIELSATLVYEYGGFKRVIDCRAYGEPTLM